MLGNSFFITNSSNPDKPAETWTLVYSKANGGNYSYNAGWGKYKIEISGGGGSGSSVAIRKTGTISNRSQTKGSAGELKTVYVTVPYGQTNTVSGEVGKGATGSTTYASTSGTSITLGTPGTGYGVDGATGTSTRFLVANGTDMQGHPIDTGYGAMAGGSGGGATSVLVGGSLLGVGRGGNGGKASLYNSYNDIYTQTPQTFSVVGGVGGYGGVSNGTGSAGGAASYAAGSGNTNTSGSGVDGYVKIYISNLKPEPL